MTVQQINQDNIDSFLHDNAMAVLVFTAEWCVPCQSFHQVIAQLVEQYSDVAFGEIDVEAQPELKKEFEVMSVPWIMILRDKVVVYAESGTLSVTNMRELLDQAKQLPSEASDH